jgi:predicted  nucleic acid-binding Zn-ribbon protein
MSGVRQLYQLQLVDTEHEEKSQRLAEVEASLGESGDVMRAGQDVVEIEEDLRELRTQTRALDLDLAGVSAKLKTNQDRLYSGRVRNPKELASLQEEAGALRRRVGELEDRELELMIAIEEQEAELAERQARLHQIESMWREEQASFQNERGQLELDLAALEEQRERIRARIGAADRALYDDLRDRLGGVAVVLLKRGLCQRCNVDVPTGLAKAVERGEMHYCPTCNRLLFSG